MASQERSSSSSSTSTVPTMADLVQVVEELIQEGKLSEEDPDVAFLRTLPGNTPLGVKHVDSKGSIRVMLDFGAQKGLSMFLGPHRLHLTFSRTIRFRV